MTPSTVPTPDTVQSRHSGLNAGCARRRSGRRPRLRPHPPGLTPADARSPPARPLFRPNRVHFRLGPVFCLGQLPTSHHCDAVGLGYTVVARFNWTQTFTGWFHGFISARRARGLPPLWFRGGEIVGLRLARSLGGAGREIITVSAAR